MTFIVCIRQGGVMSTATRSVTKFLVLLIAFLYAESVLHTQELPTDMPHAPERARFPESLYRDVQLHLPDALDADRPPTPAGAPFNVVYGWYPYWINSSATTRLRADLLTHVAWFSVGVDTATGALQSLDGWRSTQVVQWAKSKGLKVHLTITCFGSKELRALLSSPARRARCIQEIAAAVALREADGVNVDFESLPSSERLSMVSFMQGLRAALPDKELTMATPSVDWNSSWDLKSLSLICDFLVLMGYDYYWSGSTTAGPVAPLRGETYTVSKSIDAHLNGGVDPSRLVVAVPLYGRTWTVTSTARKASVVSGTNSSTPTYSTAQTQDGMSSRLFDATTSVAWFNAEAGGTIRQTWIDDSLSLDAKYRHIKSKGLRGIGYWALGYDGGQQSMWNGLAAVASTTDVAEQEDGHSRAEHTGSTIEVYSLLGQRVFRGPASDLAFARLPTGVYVCYDGRTTMMHVP